MKLEKAVLVVVMNKSKEDAGNILDEAAAILNKGGGPREEGTFNRVRDSKKELRIREVQYNPSSLRLAASGTCVVTSLTFDLFFSGENTRKMIQGVMGLVSSKDNQCVMFCWGNTAFQGETARISTEYTLFDRDGKPMLGKASLTIRQGDNSMDRIKYWDQAFDRLIGRG